MAAKKTRDEWIASELADLAAQEKLLREQLDHFAPIAKGNCQLVSGPLGAAVILPDTVKNAAMIVAKTNAELLAIKARRSKYCDLDAAEKHEVTTKESEATPAEARRLMAEKFGALMGDPEPSEN